MTKTELIKKVAKNVGVPDTDAKIFFELFLKRISAVVEIGQSIYVKDFGYFHLIKGNIKKPVFSFKDNEVSEEAVELVLFSEDKDLRKSDTKGLVFNIPYFDEDDYHPIDSAFSLSIGKPLIPLRGVPFDNIYMPTSGYEYRRLIESKVEKIISSSEIAESEENFPTLVIDARSYNSNQVQFQWDDNSNLDQVEPSKISDKTEPDVKPALSEYEKQTKELKNIAWDFGEDLSQQIEAESILEIADERINMDVTIKQKLIADDEPLKIETELNDTNLEQANLIVAPEVIEDLVVDQSSEKLNELLESENEPTEKFEEKFLDQNLDDTFEGSDLDAEPTDTVEIKDDFDEEIIIENSPEPTETVIEESLPIESELSDEDFWKSSSKYFEPYKPTVERVTEEENPEENVETDNSGLDDRDESDQAMNKEIREVIENNIVLDVDSSLNESNIEINNEIQENIMAENIEEDKIELEQSHEQQAEYFEPAKKKNLIPFIVFPILVIGLSVALYWYLEFYKKSEITPKPVQIILKTDNAKIVQRTFDIPVTYPYLPKVKETTISETIDTKTEVQNTPPEKTEIVKDEQVKLEEKKVEKEIPKQNVTETKEPVKQIVPTGTSLNVGNNIYKYGNYFVVQVAAFRSSSISENEAGKYRNKGYNAFVEEAEIPGRGIWYRVRVGNFNNKEEAQIFANKNVR